MKKFFASVAALVLAVSLGGPAMAQGRGGGCGNCGEHGAGMKIPADQFHAFQMQTIDLRQEMMNKRFDLQRENLKGAPDAAKLAALKADIALLQTKIAEIRLQNGLPDKGKRDGECFSMDGGCKKQGPMGGCNGPCGQNR